MNITLESAAAYFSSPVRTSIISDETLSFLVRYGAGRFHLSKTTEKSYLNIIKLHLENPYRENC